MSQDDTKESLSKNEAKDEKIIETVKMEWEKNQRKFKELNPAKIYKALKITAALAFFVPFISVNALAIYRSVDQMIAVHNSLEPGLSDGGEFDPSLGAEVHSENGRALIVVHERFGVDTLPWKFQNNEEYQEYLHDLDIKKDSYLNNGDVVVVVQELGTFAQEDHIPKENVVYLITNPNNGFSDPIVAFEGKIYSQNTELLFQTLRNAGVETVEMGGEFRGACVYQVMGKFKNAGFEIGWCIDCVYPQVDADEMDKYPPIAYKDE